MEIKDFKVEQWMNTWETKCRYNIAETCTESLTLKDLFRLCQTDQSAWFNDFNNRRMSYGAIEGSHELLSAISTLYSSVKPEHIIPTHGAAGANALVLTCLVNPGDHVISIKPTYQQLYSIPEMCGAHLDILELDASRHYHVEIEKLETLCQNGVKLICLNNPDNPTGALLDRNELKAICEIARKYDAWLLVDEVYRLLTQNNEYQESAVDLYDKAIVTSSMSKVFSLAGIRLGWVVTKNSKLRKALLSHRDYNLISCGIFDEAIGALALSYKDTLLSRSRHITQQNLALLDKWISQEKHLSYVKPQAGTTALIYYDFNIDSYTFCTDLIKTTGVLVTPGDCFDVPQSVRIGYAYSENSESLTEGLKSFSTFISMIENRENNHKNPVL